MSFTQTLRDLKNLSLQPPHHAIRQRAESCQKKYDDNDNPQIKNVHSFLVVSAFTHLSKMAHWIRNITTLQPTNMKTSGAWGVKSRVDFLLNGLENKMNECFFFLNNEILRKKQTNKNKKNAPQIYFQFAPFT